MRVRRWSLKCSMISWDNQANNTFAGGLVNMLSPVSRTGLFSFNILFVGTSSLWIFFYISSFLYKLLCLRALLLVCSSISLKAVSLLILSVFDRTSSHCPQSVTQPLSLFLSLSSHTLSYITRYKRTQWFLLCLFLSPKLKGLQSVTVKFPLIHNANRVCVFVHFYVLQSERPVSLIM